MSKLNTKNCLQVAIANIYAINLYDNKNYTKELKQVKKVLQNKLMDILGYKKITK